MPLGAVQPNTSVIRQSIPIDPLLYPPETGLLSARSRHFSGLHGFLADSLPDGWGALLTRLRLRNLGFGYDALDGVDKLALVGMHGRGALTFEPATMAESAVLSIDLDALAEQSRSILLGQEIDEIDKLATLGGSSGGARPKVQLGIAEDGSYSASDDPVSPDHEAWIVKFRATNDPVDIGPVEEAYAQMARLAGIAMAQTRLLPARNGPGHFATRRFDRPAPGKRVHMVSLSGAIEAPWDVPGSIDYDMLLRVTSRITRAAGDVEEAFRRMLFNILTHNRDDHSRQHSYLMDRNGEWRLAPAYDLTFSDGPGGEHYLAVQGKGRDISKDDVLALGRNHGLSSRKVIEIADDVKAAVSHWPVIAGTVGVEQSLAIVTNRLAIVAKAFG